LIDLCCREFGLRSSECLLGLQDLFGRSAFGGDELFLAIHIGLGESDAEFCLGDSGIDGATVELEQDISLFHQLTFHAVDLGDDPGHGG
jgi:hypothetical protein